MTNAEFAQRDPEFRAACERAGVEPTKRRAARWRKGTGYVYGYRIGGPQEFAPPLIFLDKRDGQVLTQTAK